MRIGSSTFLLAAMAVAAVAAGGCDSDPLAPFQPQITNRTDTFDFQAADVVGVTATITYEWGHTTLTADVHHATTTTAGEARLAIRDHDGNLVYDEVLVPDRTEPTAAGLPGAWEIRLVLTDYSGTLNFRVQAR